MGLSACRGETAAGGGRGVTAALPMEESPAPEELGWNLFQDDGEADEAFGKSSLLSSQSLSPPHPHNDSLRFFTDAELDATPVERESLKRHTRLYGLFFKELSVEIRFMDSQATLRRRTGYWGYRIISTMAILLDLSIKLLPQLYRRWACSEAEEFAYKEQVSRASHPTRPLGFCRDLTSSLSRACGTRSIVMALVKSQPHRYTMSRLTVFGRYTSPSLLAGLLWGPLSTESSTSTGGTRRTPCWQSASCTRP